MKLLMVIDVQNDFVTGSLGTPEAQAIIPNIVAKLEKYQNEQDPVSQTYPWKVFFTLDTHYHYNYLKTQEGKNLPIYHCLRNTPGWCLVDDIYKYSRSDYKDTIEKDKFGLTEGLLKYDIINNLDNQKVEEIEFIGLTTDICVISNVLFFKSLYPEIPIVVDASCCAGTTPEKHKAALEVMKSCQVKIINE